MEAFGFFLLGTLGTLGTLGALLLTVLFQGAMEDLVATILPGRFLVGNYRNFRGKWRVSYDKGGTKYSFEIDFKQINKKVWGTSEIEPQLKITYKMFGRLRGDKLSGTWEDINPQSAYHGVYFVDIDTNGDTAKGTILSEDNTKKVIQYPSDWERV